MDLISTMIEHHIWHVGELIGRASRLDEAQLDAPIEMSVETNRRQPNVANGSLSARRSIGDLERRGRKPTV